MKRNAVQIKLGRNPLGGWTFWIWDFVALRAGLPLADPYFARLVQFQNLHPRGFPIFEMSSNIPHIMSTSGTIHLIVFEARFS